MAGHSDWQTWRDLADAFRARTTHSQFTIAYPFDHLHADPGIIAKEFGAAARRAISLGDVAQSGQQAHNAVHYAEISRQGFDVVGAAVLDGGPRDPLARDDLHHQFRVFAHCGVKLAGLLIADEAEALQVWCECLRRRRYSLRLGTIQEPGEASAVLCLHFDALPVDDVKRELAFASRLWVPQRSAAEVQPAVDTVSSGAMIVVPTASETQSVALLEPHTAQEHGPADGERVFRRAGSRWELVFAGARNSVSHMEGLELIRTLLTSPKQRVSAMTLMRAETVVSTAEFETTEVTSTNGFEGLPAFDEQARKQYLEHITRLRQATEEAELRGEQEKVATYRDEMKAIAEHVDQSLDLHGRARAIGSERDRARKAASARFKRAVRRIGEALPALAAHLRDTIECGQEFEYRPPNDVRWVTQ